MASKHASEIVFISYFDSSEEVELWKSGKMALQSLYDSDIHHFHLFSLYVGQRARLWRNVNQEVRITCRGLSVAILEAPFRLAFGQVAISKLHRDFREQQTLFN